MPEIAAASTTTTAASSRTERRQEPLDANIIIANAPDPVFVSDLQGQILQANDAVYELLGFRTDEVLEQSLSRFISPEETREFMAALDEVIEKGVTRNVVLNPKSASGEIIPTSLNASALRDADGKVIGAIGILRDMRELDKARAYAESLIKNAPDPVFVSDLEGKILLANDAVSQLLGFRTDELIEQSLSRIISPEETRDFLDALREVVEREESRQDNGDAAAQAQAVILANQRGVTRNVVLNPKSATGEIISTSLNASALRDADGKVIGAIGILRDMRELDKARAYAESLIKNAPDPVFVSDLEGKILLANDAVSQLLGFRTDELIEQSLSRIISPEETRDFLDALREVVEREESRQDNGDAAAQAQAVILANQRGVTRNVVLNPKSATGEIISTSLNASALRDADGKVIGAIGILRDMRELDKARAYAESLIKNAPDPVFVSDLEGKILLANDAVYELLGFRTDEVLEQSLSRFISAEETREFTAALREVVERGVTRDARLNPRSASGEVIPTTMNASALRDRGGTVIGAIGILRDMRELDKARVYVESLIKFAPDPVFVSDLEGKILQTNDAVSQLLGFRPDEVIEQSLSRFISAKEAHEFTAALREVVERGVTRNVALNPRSASGEVIPTSLNASALRDADGKVIGAIGILRDMRELDKARAYADSLIKNAPDPVFVSDLQGKILQANDAVYELLGFRTDEVLEQSLSRFISAEETREFLAALREVIERGVIRNTRLNPRSASGEVMSTTLNASALRDSDGRVIGAIGMLRDMREIDKARAYADSLIKNAPDPVFVSDLEGKILLANDAVYELLGFRTDEVLEQSLSRFISAEETREFLAALREVIERGVIRNTRLNPRRASGEVISTTLNASALRDSDGRVIGAIGMLRDMRELDKALAYSDSLIKNAPDPVFVSDLEGKILQANDAVYELLGFRTDEVLEQSLSRFISPEETREFTAALREVIERGATRNARLNPRSASGEVIPTTLNASALRDTDGRVIGAIGILRDMRAYEKVVRDLQESKSELQEKILDLEKFEEVVVGRELKMIALEKEIENLKKELEKQSRGQSRWT